MWTLGNFLTSFPEKSRKETSNSFPQAREPRQPGAEFLIREGVQLRVQVYLLRYIASDSQLLPRPFPKFPLRHALFADVRLLPTSSPLQLSESDGSLYTRLPKKKVLCSSPTVTRTGILTEFQKKSKELGVVKTFTT